MLVGKRVRARLAHKNEDDSQNFVLSKVLPAEEEVTIHVPTPGSNHSGKRMIDNYSSVQSQKATDDYKLECI
jgi:hypothetical protein